MKRAEQTYSLLICKPITESTNTVEISGKIILNDHLREMNLGILEAKLIAKMNKKQKNMLRQLQSDPNYRDHNGESPTYFFYRVNSFLLKL